MSKCGLCGAEVVADKYFSVRSVCAGCGGDLHICINCRFYSEKSHNRCSEPKAEHQRSREKANFCDYFEFGGGRPAGTGNNKSEAIRNFEDLFRKD